jgi:hypothetical protein
MSAQGYGLDITLLAAADLSAKQFHLIKIDGTGKAALAGLGEDAIGVLQNKPASGQAATVRINGKSKVVADVALTAGQLVKSSVDAQAAVATKGSTNTSDAGAAADALVGSNVVGVVLEGTANAGEIASILILQMGVIATTAA